MGVLSSADDATAAQKLDETHKRNKKQQGNKMRSRADVVSQAVEQRMSPHMTDITQALKAKRSVIVPPQKELEISWDVRRIVDAEVPWAYAFRLGVKNVSPRPCPLQGLARFYVLRAPNGMVFPIHRITEGPASFTIDPGEEYKYSWIFYTKYKTTEASGGILVENKAKEGGVIEEQFLNATLPPLEPAKAEGIKSEKLQTFMRSYNFMGALDLRGVTYV